MAISPGEATLIRAELARVGLPHTYSRTVLLVSTVDDWNDATKTAGPTTPGLRCRYRSDDRLRTDDGGRVTVSVPNISVAHDDATAVGDLVSNVRDAVGNLLLAGPLAVESISLSAAFGPVLDRRL